MMSAVRKVAGVANVREYYRSTRRKSEEGSTEAKKGTVAGILRLRSRMKADIHKFVER